MAATAVPAPAHDGTGDQALDNWCRAQVDAAPPLTQRQVRVLAALVTVTTSRPT
jgi:hypothetical protein